jgi:hypothetical protein
MKSTPTRAVSVPTLRNIRKLWRRTREGKKSGIIKETGELRRYIAATTFSSTIRMENLKEKIRGLELGADGQKIYDSLVALYGEVELLSSLATFLYGQTKES